MKKRLSALARWILSAAILAVLIDHVGPRTLLARLRDLDAGWLALVFALLLGEAFVRCLNWHQLARGAGCPISLRDVIYSYLAGGFVGALLPSTLGTDAARSAVAASRTGARVEVLLATTVSLNLISLLTLSGWALVAGAVLIASGYGSSPTLLLSLAIGAGCVVLIGGLIVLCLRRGAAAVPPVTDDSGHRLRSAAQRVLGRFMGALLVFHGGPRDLLRVAATATITCALRTIGFLVVLTAAGVSVPLVVLFALGPTFAIAGALPVSVGGFGGMQAIVVYMLADWGVTAGQAMAVSLVQSALYVALNVTGSIAYAAGGSGARASVSPGGR